MLLGWIKLHRQLLDNWVMTEPEALSVWIRFLLEANHESKKKMLNGSLVEVKRGQLIFGLEAFSVRSGVSISKLRRYLKLFEKEGMINRLKTAKYSIITIASFESHQSGDSLTTSKRQANDKQTTTPKECKNEKNEKNSIYFDSFWSGYPKKVSKPQAEKAFKKVFKDLKLNDHTAVEFIEMIHADCKKRFSDTEKQFIPNAATYLNNDRWQDEY